LFLTGVTEATSRGDERPLEYLRDVRPILARNCFACHGADEAHRKTGLRLDTSEGATAELDDGNRAIVPGDLEASELIFRITETDDTVRMPPPKTGGALPAEDVEILKRWVEQGAGYAEHWAFVAPQRHAWPAAARLGWARNEIDAWIQAGHESAGLEPSDEADRYALLRRLSLDLRGLPPEPEEVERFADDGRPDAFERQVDQYLADPAYGERWARMWLDLARYADSAGFGSDPLRPNMWRYRDWVIEALNKNQPYDEFVTDQLAGDLTPDATLDQRIATAFHRNTMTNTEGGTDDEEFRVAAIKDRVDTTGQVFLGLTLGCAKCHNHKYDPISQREYYQFYDFFNQTADNDQPDERPTVPAPTPEQAAENARIDAETAVVRAKMDETASTLAAAQGEWEASMRGAVAWVPLAATIMTATEGTQLEGSADGSIRAIGGRPGNDTYRIEAVVPSGNITGLRLEVLPEPLLVRGGPGRAGDGNFVLSQVRVEARDTAEGSWRSVALSRAVADFTQGGFAAQSVIWPTLDPGSGWAIAPKMGSAHELVVIAAEPTGGDGPTRLVVELDHRYKEAGYTLGRFRLSATRHSQPARNLEASSEVLAAIDTPDNSRASDQRKRIAEYFRSVAPELKPFRDEIARLETSRPAVPALPVMSELPADKHRVTRLMHKGNHLDPGGEVHAGVLTKFHALPSDATRDRRALARWIMDPANPLTARVAANRMWAQFFGVGIVETEEDFGSQGELPSHPGLLDALALRFQGDGWDMKVLARLIVTSTTYRQTPRVSPETLAKDPRNRLLARAPRVRLEAELIRDQAMALSGLLARKIGGPSVYPPQPDGLWQAAFNGQRTWATSTGYDRYRRGLYTFWRRTIPYPSMATFDAPSREICAIKRTRTNSPLQAFVTLNDVVYIEAAQALARRIVREGGDSVESRMRYALLLSLGRPAEDEQVKVLLDLFEAERSEFASNLDAAKALATDPLGPLPEGADAAELAAWTSVANVLLNLDGVLTKG
jgi:hypothetical protein